VSAVSRLDFSLYNMDKYVFLYEYISILESVRDAHCDSATTDGFFRQGGKAHLGCLCCGRSAHAGQKNSQPDSEVRLEKKMDAALKI